MTACMKKLTPFHAILELHSELCKLDCECANFNNHGCQWLIVVTPVHRNANYTHVELSQNSPAYLLALFVSKSILQAPHPQVHICQNGLMRPR